MVEQANQSRLSDWLLRCGISIRPTSALGQPRRFCHVGPRSAKPPKASGKADLASPEDRAVAVPPAVALRFRPAPIWPERHQYRCPDSAPCSRSSCAPAKAEPHVDCRCGGRSALPLSAAASACRTSQSAKRRAYCRVVIPCPARRPLNRYSPGSLPPVVRYSSIASRVCSVSSNRTGRPVFLWRTDVRSIA